MRILVLASKNPYPPNDGGKYSIYFSIKHLIEKVDVGLFFFYDKEYPVETVVHLEGMGIKVFPFKHNTKDSFYGVAKNIFEKKPYKVKKYYSRRALEYIKEIVKDFHPDIIQCCQVHMAHYALKTRKQFLTPIVLREQNIEYVLVEQYIRLQRNIFLKFMSYWQYVKMRHYERAVWGKCDRVIFISENDLRIAVNHSCDGSEKFLSIQDGMLGIHAGKESSIKRRHSIVFAGNLKTVQNCLSISWFIKSVWPLIKKKEETATLYLYGGGEEILYKELGISKKDFIELSIMPMGFVEDIDSEIRKYEIFISPSIIGSGLRLKVLRAMSLGMTIVCTNIDAVGIDHLKNDVHAIVVNGADAFANAILTLFEDKVLRDTLGKNAAAMVAEFYTWECYTQKIIHEYTDIVA